MVNECACVRKPTTERLYGAMITMHWAQQHNRKIHGALLARPVDLETPLPDGYLTFDAIAHNGWHPISRKPLPFPTIVAASRNHPLARFERVAQMAQDWAAASSTKARWATSSQLGASVNGRWRKP